MFKWFKDKFNSEEKQINKDEKSITSEEKEENKKSEEVETQEEKSVSEDLESNDDINFKKVNTEEKVEEDIVEEDKDKISDEEFSKISEVVTEDVIPSDENIDNNEEAEEKGGFGFFKKIFTGLEKTRNNFTDRINEVLGNYVTIDDDLYEELEDILITADVGVDTTLKLIDNLRETIKEEKVQDPNLVLDLLAKEANKLMEKGEENRTFDPSKTPTIILVVGVNGVGKTTTIGKLASRYKSKGKKVLLVAADTFRAAATEQLQEWANRANVDIIHQGEGADPGAVVYDAIQAAKSRKSDIILCDTAGRLHNKANLMTELEKIYKIIDKNFPEANKESLIVLDATTGQNALIQGKEFKDVTNVTGAVITKLDGTAKGGIVLPLIDELEIPVEYIGVGEQIDDLQPFDSEKFIKSIFGIK